MSSKINSRTITHDIPIKVVSAKQQDDFREPSIERTTLSIEMPPLKLFKHMIERMKFLGDFVILEATNKGIDFFMCSLFIINVIMGVRAYAPFAVTIRKKINFRVIISIK